jgi:hypothetical protein
MDITGLLLSRLQFATGAWCLLRGTFAAEAKIMLRMGLYLAAVLTRKLVVRQR